MELNLKKRLIFIGNIFYQNRPFRDYIIRSVEADGIHLDSVEYYMEADQDLFETLLHRFKGEENIYLVTGKKSFTLVGKRLCTVLDDTLILKEQMLLPSQCKTFSRESYLLDISRSHINVIQADESKAMPKLLLSGTSSKQKMHFFEVPIEEVIERASPLAKQFDVELTFSQRVENWVEVEVRCMAYGSTDKFMQIVKERYRENVIVAQDLVQHIIDAANAAGQKITLAESCTGGLLAYYFTSHAGVSSVFEGSLVTYSDTLKESWLAVESATLIDHGAVSEKVVSEMCGGALSVADADYALAISGIAGPDGGSEEKPVGTVVIGVKSKSYEKVVRCLFDGDRN
ncbi:MAG: CinA family protein, partial [Thiovulaceae bacterium]|nr:CinA family protein [Sulfurimonadaceae bacterium]